ncbi:efflux RND transporter periplasmic adaptor subunit [Ancylobacter dichloromethanicus]|uniref:Hemolysin secretion protein D n=1 Tax=Ancylobacter dichloromethanicus TaxID=518825 RepID=A0A9W6JBP5_9HYPH|nr:efflux RND transporter periplasmic adaptor subunit [Ancylobacter dichloromethanicus]MBS7553283.1 efflux RND transporter periplasmic adaptor subunit [Ancylobacter dichloromethanicus]GLK73064.1 hemolysin secretion protein D [Ancylobacter dichloromethanicus]
MTVKPPSLRGRVTLALTMTAVVVGLAGYAFRDRIAAGLSLSEPAQAEVALPSPNEVKGITITVVPAARREVVENLPVTGTLVAREEIMVGPQIDGYQITDILVEEGDRVEQGQVLARLSRDMLETLLAQNTANAAKAQASIAQQKAQLQQMLAQLTEAEAAVERARTLIKTGATSQEVLDQRERAVKVSSAQVTAAQEMVTAAEAEAAQIKATRDEIEVRLARTEIKAPQAGIVSARSARIGAIVLSANAEPLFRIVKDGAIDLDAEVPESALPRVTPGLKVAVTPAGFDAPLDGSVRLVGAKVDPATRLARVAVALPDDPGLRPGAYARGVIEIARHDGVALPQSAVQFAPEGAFVLVVEGDTVRHRPVSIGLKGDGFVEIAEGVREGESVVARAAGFLRDGDRVTPVPLPTETAKGGV